MVGIDPRPVIHSLLGVNFSANQLIYSTASVSHNPGADGNAEISKTFLDGSGVERTSVRVT